MAKSACAVTRHLSSLRDDVVQDIVATTRVTADAPGSRRDEIVEIQIISGAPCDVVIRTRRVAADADAADEVSAGVVETQPAAEHVHPADSSTYHGIISLAVVAWTPAICNVRVHGIARLKPVETATRLDGG